MTISVPMPGRRGVTLKPDIKVETVNKETHSLEEEAASASTATRMVKAMYSDRTNGYYVRATTHDVVRASSRSLRYTYAHFNTIARASQIQAPSNSVSKTTDFSGDRGLLESTNPLAFDSYAYSTTPQYRLGFAPPLEAGPAYEMYPTGQGVGSQEANVGKYPSSAQFPYSTPPTEYSQRHTQRMQTHV